nr:MAG TPA: hypothetical protein [Caudoviricetes sp.]
MLIMFILLLICVLRLVTQILRLLGILFLVLLATRSLLTGLRLLPLILGMC